MEYKGLVRRQKEFFRTGKTKETGIPGILSWQTSEMDG